MTANRFNFRAYIKPYNKIYKVHSIEMSGNFLAIECFQEDGETLLKRNDNETNLFLFKQGEFNLMQSTGLVDKNGKEIFEGDILTDGSIKYLVRFEKEKACFIMKPILCGKTLLKDYEKLDRRYMHYYEIIGNIYENPELLKS